MAAEHEIDQRGDLPGRRSYDQQPTPAPALPLSPWRAPQIYISILLALITVVTVIRSTARNETIAKAAQEQASKDIAAVLNRLDKIDERVADQRLSDNTRANDIAGLKQQFAEWKADISRQNEVRDTWIQTTREKVGKLEEYNALRR